jgi:uncharacterized membrane protein YdjX (TVP38/TMEM64 family)
MLNLLRMIKTYLVLCILALVCFSFFYWHLYDYLTIANLRAYKGVAQIWTNTHYEAAVAIYILTYVIMIACAIPCATLLTLLGGFLFGGIAFIYAMFSTTLGGVILFLAIRSSIGYQLAARSSGWIKRLESGFKRNAFNYILMLRLIPVMPCWVSNITAGVLNVPLRTFIGATVLGIIPATFIYAMAGRGLDKILTNNNMPLSQLILAPSVFFPLLGLAFLSIFPVIYKSMKNTFWL